MADSVTVRGGFTAATLDLMQDLVEKWCRQPYMVQVARAICSNAGAKSRADEARAIHDWIFSNIQYRRDPIGTEWIQDPFETLVNSRAGDCDDLAVLAGTLLQAVGHPCDMKAVQWAGMDDFSHAVCYDETTKTVIDCVNPSMSWPPAGKVVSAALGAK